MENVPQNDLLSAYLDGELTAEEESQVERLLAASPEARQLLDELRALSSSLQALPPLAVGEDISEQVLRRAERRMLSEPEKDLSEHDESEGDEEASSPEPRVWRTILRRALRPRNLAWSGVVVAVALLLMVMGRNQPGESPRRVAMNKAPAEREASRVVSEEPSMRAAPEPADEALAGAAAPTEKPAEALAEESTAEPAKYGSRPRGDLAAEKAGGPVELRERRAPPAEPPPMAAPSTAPLAEKESKAAPPAVAPGMAGPDNRRSGERYGMSGAGGTAGSGEALGSRGRARPERAAKQGPWKGQPLPSAVQAELAGPGNAPAGEPGVESDESLPADALAEVTLVVSCDVTPDALHRQVFPELLERQQLAQTPQEAPPGPVAGKDAPAPRAQLQYHAEAPGPGVLAYDVEATPGQIQAILSDLEQRPKEFQSLTFALAPAASQSTPGRARAMGEQTQAGRVNQSVQQNVQTDQATSPGGPESLAIGAAQPQDEGLGGARQQQLSRGEVDRLLGDAVRRQAGVQTGPDVNAFQESTAQTVNSAAPGVQSQRMEGGLPSAAKPAGIGAQQQAAPEQPRPAPAAQFAFPGGNAAQPGSGAFGAGMQAAPTQQLALQELQQSDAAKCRVVFVMRVVKPEGGNVAASRIAKEAPAAAMEAAEREATEAPAPAAPAPKPEP